MAQDKKKKKKKLIIVILGIIIVIILIIAFILIWFKQNSATTSNNGEATIVTNDIEEASNQAELEALYNMSEQERITYYCAEFFKLVDRRNYEDAYELLYSGYKENYFPTQASFTEYMEDYFPDDFSLSYTNFERLGDIYVLWIDVKDTLNGSRGHNFSMNVVIQENDFNDYVLSFSRNSAVDSEEE